MGGCRANSWRRYASVCLVAAMAVLPVACSSDDDASGPALVVAEPTPTPIMRPPGSSAVFIEDFVGDEFDPDADPLRWTTDGDWEVVGDGARITGEVAPTAPSVASIDVGGADGVVQVTMRVAADDAGLTFRYAGPRDHWAIVGAPSFGTWNLVRVVDGEEELVFNLGAVNAGDGAVIGVILDGDTISVTVDGRVRRSLTDATHASATRAGLWAGAPTARSARWDDFVAIAAGPAAPVEGGG